MDGVVEAVAAVLVVEYDHILVRILLALAPEPVRTSAFLTGSRFGASHCP